MQYSRHHIVACKICMIIHTRNVLLSALFCYGQFFTDNESCSSLIFHGETRCPITSGSTIHHKCMIDKLCSLHSNGNEAQVMYYGYSNNQACPEYSDELQPVPPQFTLQHGNETVQEGRVQLMCKTPSTL